VKREEEEEDLIVDLAPSQRKIETVEEDTKREEMRALQVDQDLDLNLNLNQRKEEEMIRIKNHRESDQRALERILKIMERTVKIRRKVLSPNPDQNPNLDQSPAPNLHPNRDPRVKDQIQNNPFLN